MATKKDFTQVAHDVVMRATGQVPAAANEPMDFTQAALDAVQRATGGVTAPTPSKKQGAGHKIGPLGSAASSANTAKKKP